MNTRGKTPRDAQAPDVPQAPGTPPARTESAAGPSGRWLLGAGVLVLFAASLAYGAWRQHEENGQVLEAAAATRNAAARVRLGDVRTSDAVFTLTLPATTSAFEAVSVFARASGYIEKRFVDIGSRVKTGDILARISAPELDHQIALAEATLAQNEAALAQAKANRDLAKVTWDRNAKLVDQGYVSLQDGDVARLTLEARASDVHSAEATVQAQREQIKVLRQQKDYQRVAAPFDGVVTQRNVDNGSLVQADATSGTALFALSRGDVIRIQLYVPQDAAVGVTPGVAAVVRVPEIPGRTFPGQVTRVANTLQPNTRTLLTEIDVQNADGALTPGIYCNVALQVPRRTPSLLVPSEAVIFNKAGMQVVVVQNGVARIRKIAVVRDFGTEVEVGEGVKAGDKVVLNPPVDLADGGKVQVDQPSAGPSKQM
ncbi:efflux RND transporter periplasmic adaptor subunit [Solidesulfovibrio sp.]|uniref:efflux RND transporter periplasmic adaptor subunit n=1 Tax=Solidesulfovibrio sp. TaxID=2910990 RepID=UPI0026187A7F|nr:efflux RND transporter periplasmic adaptor subunit [Solidesulfovibrio sp.]